MMILMMYRLRRNDVDYFVTSDIIRFAHNDAMFAFMCPQATSFARKGKHHAKTPLPKSGVFVGAGGGTQNRGLCKGGFLRCNNEAFLHKP